MSGPARGGGVSKAYVDAADLLVESGRGVRPWVTLTAYPQWTALTDGTAAWRVLVTGYTSGASIAADVTAGKLALLPGGGGAGTILPWAALTAYVTGQPMTQGGVTYLRIAPGTSRATFDTTEFALWTPLPAGSAPTGPGYSFMGRALMPIGDRGVMSYAYAVADHVNMNTRSRQKVTQAASALAVAFNNPQPLPGNAITITASVDDGTKIVPLTFNGRTSVSIDPGYGIVVSDPAAVSVAAGAYVWVRSYQAVTAGQTYIRGNGTTVLANGEGVDFDTGVDKTRSGTIPTANDNAYHPVAVLAVPSTVARPLITAVGDSVTAGTGETAVLPDTSNPSTSPVAYGYARRIAVAGGNGFINGALAGELASQFMTAGLSNDTRRQIAAQGKHVIVGYGINDIAGGASGATVLARLQAIWAQFLTGRIAAITMPPRTTSTDAWATTANQTVIATESARLALNALLRALPLGGPGSPPSTLIDLELGGAFTRVSDSAIVWAAGATSDGIHPNSAGHAAIAAAQTVATFA